MICINCGEKCVYGTWYLKKYYGVSGNFCRKCYDLVSHDPFFGIPRHPEQYKAILVAQEIRKFQNDYYPSKFR